MNLKKIKEQLDTQAGKELKEYLLLQLKELRDIDNIKECKAPTHQAIEVKSQKRAFEKLRTILGEIVSIEELDEKKKEKDSYFSI